MRTILNGAWTKTISHRDVVSIPVLPNLTPPSKSKEDFQGRFVNFRGREVHLNLHRR